MKLPDWLPVFGDMDYREDKPPSEALEQVTFFGVLRREYPDLASAAVHIRNEGKRSHRETLKQKAEGLNTGASDIIIPGNPSFVCEMKRIDHTKSKISQDQLDYLLSAKDNGSFICVALGYKAALQAVEEWQKILKKDQA